MKQQSRGNIRERDGQWHYRFNFRGREYSGPTGLPAGVSNRSAAEEVAMARRRELEQQKPAALRAVPVASIDPGFRAIAAAFLAWCRDTEYRAKPNTAERLRVSFVSLTEFFGATSLRQIDAAAIERYKANRAGIDGVRDVTIRHDLHALSVFFRKYACRRGLAVANPVDMVSIPSDADAIREHVITAEEEDAYFAAVEMLHAKYCKSFPAALPNLADVARIMLEQGPRPEEILASRKIHFDSGAVTLRVPGGKSRAARRTLHLTSASLAILQRRAAIGGESSPWLFPSDRNPGHHLTKLAGAHDRACIEAGVSFRIYDFRHTFATRAIESGIPVAVVAAILGHSGLRTIHRYVHPTNDAQKSAMQRVDADAQIRRAG
jgi:integrase